MMSTTNYEKAADLTTGGSTTLNSCTGPCQKEPCVSGCPFHPDTVGVGCDDPGFGGVVPLAPLPISAFSLTYSQELYDKCLSLGFGKPGYEVELRDDGSFWCNLTVGEISVFGIGRSKKFARQGAARTMLQRLPREPGSQFRLRMFLEIRRHAKVLLEEKKRHEAVLRAEALQHNEALYAIGETPTTTSQQETIGLLGSGCSKGDGPKLLHGLPQGVLDKLDPGIVKKLDEETVQDIEDDFLAQSDPTEMEDLEIDEVFSEVVRKKGLFGVHPLLSGIELEKLDTPQLLRNYTYAQRVRFGRKRIFALHQLHLLEPDPLEVYTSDVLSERKTSAERAQQVKKPVRPELTERKDPDRKRKQRSAVERRLGEKFLDLRGLDFDVVVLESVDNPLGIEALRTVNGERVDLILRLRELGQSVFLRARGDQPMRGLLKDLIPSVELGLPPDTERSDFSTALAFSWNKLMHAINGNIRYYLFGPPGSGKSTMISALSKAGFSAVDAESFFRERSPQYTKVYLDAALRSRVEPPVLFIGGANISLGDVDPQDKKILILPSRETYYKRRASRDRALPEKSRQADVYEAFFSLRDKVDIVVGEGTVEETLGEILSFSGLEQKGGDLSSESMPKADVQDIPTVREEAVTPKDFHPLDTSPTLSEGIIRAVIPGYGNWGGPGRSGGDPVDALDSLFMIHDSFYDMAQRWNDPQIADLGDQILVRGIDSLKDVPPYGKAAKGFFSAMPTLRSVFTLYPAMTGAPTTPVKPPLLKDYIPQVFGENVLLNEEEITGYQDQLAEGWNQLMHAQNGNTETKEQSSTGNAAAFLQARDQMLKSAAGVGYAELSDAHYWDNANTNWVVTQPTTLTYRAYSTVPDRLVYNFYPNSMWMWGGAVMNNIPLLISEGNCTLSMEGGVRGVPSSFIAPILTATEISSFGSATRANTGFLYGTALAQLCKLVGPRISEGFGTSPSIVLVSLLRMLIGIGLPTTNVLPLPFVSFGLWQNFIAHSVLNFNIAKCSFAKFVAMAQGDTVGVGANYLPSTWNRTCAVVPVKDEVFGWAGTVWILAWLHPYSSDQTGGLGTANYILSDGHGQPHPAGFQTPCFHCTSFLRTPHLGHYTHVLLVDCEHQNEDVNTVLGSGVVAGGSWGGAGAVINLHGFGEGDIRTAITFFEKYFGSELATSEALSYLARSNLVISSSLKAPYMGATTDFCMQLDHSMAAPFIPWGHVVTRINFTDGAGNPHFSTDDQRGQSYWLCVDGFLQDDESKPHFCFHEADPLTSCAIVAGIYLLPQVAPVLSQFGTTGVVQLGYSLGLLTAFGTQLLLNKASIYGMELYGRGWYDGTGTVVDSQARIDAWLSGENTFLDLLFPGASLLSRNCLPLHDETIHMPWFDLIGTDQASFCSLITMSEVVRSSILRGVAQGIGYSLPLEKLSVIPYSEPPDSLIVLVGGVRYLSYALDFKYKEEGLDYAHQSSLWRMYAFSTPHVWHTAGVFDRAVYIGSAGGVFDGATIPGTPYAVPVTNAWVILPACGAGVVWDRNRSTGMTIRLDQLAQTGDISAYCIFGLGSGYLDAGVPRTGRARSIFL